MEKMNNLSGLTSQVPVAAMGLAALAVTMDGCMVKKPSLEYAEGTMTVAVDPAEKTVNVRRVTREQVLTQMGAGAEGKQRDGSYVICADMSQVYACPDGSCMEENDKKRLAGRFESLLLGQASALLLADKCQNISWPQDAEKCGKYTGFAVPAACVGPNSQQLAQGEGTVNGLGTYKTRFDGDYVCLWTTPPEDIKCQ